MSKIQITRGISLGITYLFVEGLSGLVIPKLLLAFLPSGTAGVWIVFVSITAIAFSLQSSLGPVTTRLVAPTFLPGKNWSLEAIEKIVGRSYGLIAVLCAAILLALYPIYLSKVASNLSATDAAIGWILLVIGVSLRLHGSYRFHIVNGLGELGWDKIVMICVSLLTLSLYWCALRFNQGFIGLGAAYLLASLVFYVGANLVLRRVVLRRLLSPTNDAPSAAVGFSEKDLIAGVRQMIVLNMSGIVLMNTDVLIVERLFGAAVVPAFSLQSKISLLVVAVASLFPQMSYPYIARHWISGDHERARKQYLFSVIAAMCCATVGASLLSYVVPRIIDVWMEQPLFLGSFVFGLQLIFAVVCVHTTAQGISALATGQADFRKLAVGNALVAFPVSILCGMQWGIAGVVLGNLLVTLIPSVLHGLRAWRLFFKFHRT